LCYCPEQKTFGLGSRSDAVNGRIMLTRKERRPAYRSVEGWAISTLLEAGAIHECHDHGHYKENHDPEARARAVAAAKEEPMPGLAPDDAVAAVKEVFAAIGDTCPDCR
jgi:hypothetical protein